VALDIQQGVLHRTLHPAIGQQIPHPLRALRPHLISVLRRERHRRKDPAQELG